MQNESGFLEIKVILQGVTVGLITLIGVLFFLAILTSLFYSFFSRYLSGILIAANFTVIFCTGFYSARRVNQNGWLYGALAGLLLMAVMLVLGSIYLTIPAGKILMLFIVSIFLGSIGGIMGVNI